MKATLFASRADANETTAAKAIGGVLSALSQEAPTHLSVELRDVTSPAEAKLARDPGLTAFPGPSKRDSYLGISFVYEGQSEIISLTPSDIGRFSFEVASKLTRLRGKVENKPARVAVLSKSAELVSLPALMTSAMEKAVGTKADDALAAYHFEPVADPNLPLDDDVRGVIVIGNGSAWSELELRHIDELVRARGAIILAGAVHRAADRATGELGPERT